MAAGWKAGIVRTARGTPEHIGANAGWILTHDPAWRGVLAYNSFTEGVIFRIEPGVEGWLPAGGCKGRSWQDTDTTQLSHWLSRVHGVHLRPGDLNPVVDAIARRKAFHPVQKDLQSLVWDGTPRLDTFLIRLCGAEDTPLTRAISSKFLISAVARVFEPGCQADYVLVLEGKQGIGKSTLARVLAGSPDRYLGTMQDMGTEGAKALRGKHIVELPELDNVTRASITRMRAYITTTQDTYRDSYGYRARDFLRQCVFIGTVNPPYEYFQDVERRFWPVRLLHVMVTALRGERDQLWAEAYARYRGVDGAPGEAWHLEDKHLQKAARVVQKERRQADPWEEVILHLAGRYHSKNRVGITFDEAYRELGIENFSKSRATEARLKSVFSRLGWSLARTRRVGVRTRLFMPPEKAQNP